jgi:putative inorganic carbon (hco3(-)) transporter
MDWFFFILLNGAFFVRPGDLLQSADLPIYNILMVACLAVSGRRVLGVISAARQSPITTCVLGVVAACILSHLSHSNLRRAGEDGLYMIKIITYFLLLVALVDSPARLQSFLRWLVLLALVVAGLALVHYHGIVQIESLEACQQSDIDPNTGELFIIPRLCSTGVFSDPNDLSIIIVLAVITCLFFFDNAPRGIGRLLWFAPIGVFLYALKLTYSRGGLLTLGMGLMVVSLHRLGWKKTVMISVAALPAVLVLFGGRMTRMDVGDANDTSQQRIQLWSDGLLLFRESPVFGIGMNEYAERVGLVAHNSFVHAYAELGFFGGTLFTGAFYAAFLGVWRLGGKEVAFYDRPLMQLRPYLLAMICSYCAGIFSLSRPYTITTYLPLGVAAAYLQVAESCTSAPGLRFDAHFFRRLLLVGIGCLLFLSIFVRLMVRWN